MYIEAIYMKEQPDKESFTRRRCHTEGTLYKGDIHAEGIYTWRRHTYGGKIYLEGTYTWREHILGGDIMERTYT